MNKRKAWILGILVTLLVMGLGLFVFVKHNLPYKGTDTEIIQGNDASNFNEENVIPAWKIRFVHPGMSYEEVVHILGKANRDVGSGWRIFEYDCDNGCKLQIWPYPDEHLQKWIWQLWIEKPDGSQKLLEQDIEFFHKLVASVQKTYYPSTEPTETTAD